MKRQISRAFTLLPSVYCMLLTHEVTLHCHSQPIGLPRSAVDDTEGPIADATSEIEALHLLDECCESLGQFEAVENDPGLGKSSFGVSRHSSDGGRRR